MNAKTFTVLPNDNYDIAKEALELVDLVVLKREGRFWLAVSENSNLPQLRGYGKLELEEINDTIFYYKYESISAATYELTSILSSIGYILKKQKIANEDN